MTEHLPQVVNGTRGDTVQGVGGMGSQLLVHTLGHN